MTPNLGLGLVALLALIMLKWFKAAG